MDCLLGVVVCEVLAITSSTSSNSWLTGLSVSLDHLGAFRFLEPSCSSSNLGAFLFFETSSTSSNSWLTGSLVVRLVYFLLVFFEPSYSLFGSSFVSWDSSWFLLVLLVTYFLSGI